jgi:hypothetical protein
MDLRLASRCLALCLPADMQTVPVTPVMGTQAATRPALGGRPHPLWHAGALDRDKQIAVVSQFTALVSEAANDPSWRSRRGCS